jgi:oligopeptidase A
MNALPLFQQINVEETPKQLTETFKRHLETLEQLLKKANGHYTWENLIFPLEVMGDEWHKIIGPLAHLNGVNNTKEVREAYQACLPILTEYGLTFGQHVGLYHAIKALRESSEFEKLSSTRKKIIDDELLGFKLAGIALEGKEKARFKVIQNELSQLCNQFDNHIIDATQAWTKVVTQSEEVSGIPAHNLEEAAKLAQEKNLSGWVFTLEPPVYQAIMMYADNRALREEIYRAYVTRASEKSPSGAQWDNSLIMNQILELRHEEANLLGYSNYSELSLAQKMAETPKQVFDFLYHLAEKVKPQAKKEFEMLEAFAKNHLQMDKLNPWDVGYAGEKLREAEYAVSQNAFRPYLPHSVVLKGLFAIVGKLYGMRFEAILDVETWHSDVLFYAVYDETNAIRGYVYIDLFARSKKRGGAWMDDCLTRQRLADGSLQNPVAYLVCNFTKPAESGKEALLSHDEVVTLFHEFGHTLHHILTAMDDASVSGISGVEWDAVELPSQFFEQWCWEKEAIALFSSHIETKKPIPDAMMDKLLSAKNFQSGMHLARQLEFALFDFRIHAEYGQKTEGHIQATLDDVRRFISVVPVIEENRFQQGFSHIFSGGYAAGYYSYLWAEVLSSDAFVAFEEKGIFDKATGRKFLHEILEVGSSRPIMDSFIAFRGKKPSIDALLRHCGIEQCLTK